MEHFLQNLLHFFNLLQSPEMPCKLIKQPRRKDPFARLGPFINTSNGLERWEDGLLPCSAHKDPAFGPWPWPKLMGLIFASISSLRKLQHASCFCSCLKLKGLVTWWHLWDCEIVKYHQILTNTVKWFSHFDFTTCCTHCTPTNQQIY